MPMCPDHIENHRQSDFHDGMTRMNLWHWLNNHLVSRSEIDKKTTMIFSDLNKQKIFEQVKERLH